MHVVNAMSRLPFPSQYLFSRLFPIGIVVAALAYAGVLFYQGKQEGEEPGEAEPVSASKAEIQLAASVVQTEIDTVPAKATQLASESWFPAKLQYDPTSQLPITLGCDSFITSVDCKPGQEVTAGQTLIQLDSPQVANLRVELLQLYRERAILQKERDRNAEIATGVGQVVADIQAKIEYSELEKKFISKPLGNYRKELFSAYADFVLSNKLSSQSTQMSDSGAISGKIVVERENNLRVATVSLLTVCESSVFTSTLAHQKSANAVDNIEQSIAVKQRQVAQMLSGMVGTASNEMPTFEQLASMSIDQLSLVQIHSPINGTVEHVTVAAKQFAKMGDKALELADTSKIWVEVELRERDLANFEILPGSEIEIQIPSLNDLVVLAKVEYFGREINSQTAAIPVVASIANTDKKLRPGLLARAKLPQKTAKRVVAVPPDSVIKEGDELFVFVEKKAGVYERRDVKTGMRNESWLEITEGVNEGENVVTKGMFLLKSELLLEEEGE